MPEPSRRRRRRPERTAAPSAAPETLRELRRGQIIAAARSIVAADGLEALTISSLESRLAFTRGVITYHFRDKDDIVDAVLDSALAEIHEAVIGELRASRNLEEQVLAVLRGQVRGWLGHPEAAAIVLAFWGRLRSDRRAAARNARLYAGYRAEGVKLVEASGARIDAATVATLLVGTVIGIVCQVAFEPGAIDPEAATEEAARMFVARLRACSG